MEVRVLPTNSKRDQTENGHVEGNGKGPRAGSTSGLKSRCRGLVAETTEHGNLRCPKKGRNEAKTVDRAALTTSETTRNSSLSAVCRHPRPRPDGNEGGWVWIGEVVVKDGFQRVSSKTQKREGIVEQSRYESGKKKEV